MMRLWPLTWCKVITTWGWNCKAKPIGRNPDKCSKYNGAIGPSKKYNEDGRLALDEMQSMQWAMCPEDKSMKIQNFALSARGTYLQYKLKK